MIKISQGSTVCNRYIPLHIVLSLFNNNKQFLKLNHQLSFQDDITSTESDLESDSNDENFLISNQNQQNQQTLQTQGILPTHRDFDEENKQHLFVQSQNQKLNEKMLDNQKLLLDR